jgi:DNA adenine methylase
MQYLGGKARIGKKIAAKILEIVPPEHRLEYLEPFLGGANAFEHIAPHFEKTYAGDVHEDLILMWQAVAAGWVPPEVVTEEQYQELKKASPSALRGLVGFGCSFGGVWFSSYAPGFNGPLTYAQLACRNALRAGETLRKAQCIARVSVFDWPVVGGVVVYCHPPYAGTATYKNTATFDHAAFWTRMREWSAAGSYVFVSEESAPADWPCVWSQKRSARSEQARAKAPAGAKRPNAFSSKAPNAGPNRPSRPHDRTREAPVERLHLRPRRTEVCAPVLWR